jgi:hypothetical protein
VIDFLCTAP